MDFGKTRFNGDVDDDNFGSPFFFFVLLGRFFLESLGNRSVGERT